MRAGGVAELGLVTGILGEDHRLLGEFLPVFGSKAAVLETIFWDKDGFEEECIDARCEPRSEFPLRGTSVEFGAFDVGPDAGTLVLFGREALEGDAEEDPEAAEAVGWADSSIVLGSRAVLNVESEPVSAALLFILAFEVVAIV